VLQDLLGVMTEQMIALDAWLQDERARQAAAARRRQRGGEGSRRGGVSLLAAPSGSDAAQAFYQALGAASASFMNHPILLLNRWQCLLADASMHVRSVVWRGLKLTGNQQLQCRPVLGHRARSDRSNVVLSI